MCIFVFTSADMMQRVSYLHVFVYILVFEGDYYVIYPIK